MADSNEIMEHMLRDTEITSIIENNTIHNLYLKIQFISGALIFNCLF